MILPKIMIITQELSVGEIKKKKQKQPERHLLPLPRNKV